MEYSLLNICLGIFVVEPFVVDSFLWNLSCGTFVVRSSLWNPCCGIFVVESLLRNLRYGIVKV